MRALAALAAAAAHDAFGDLGPFYGGLMHPLADAAQGLLLAAAAVLLARQTLDVVRPAWAALALVAAPAILVASWAGLGAPGLRASGLAAAALGLLAVVGWPLGRWFATALAVGAAALAAFSIDLPPDLWRGGLTLAGGGLGVALTTLLLWGGVDLAFRRIGPVAGAVAGSWVAAVGLKAAALPA